MDTTAITVRLVPDENLNLLNTKVDPYLGQDYRTLLQECLQRKVLFEDPHFPADATSLGYNKLGPWSAETRGIQWKRPQEITQHPQFISENMKWTDICQGQLGNCWFLAAVASLTLHPRLQERVVSPQQSFYNDYGGIFHFQFWQYGEWVDVVVDDRLPTQHGELVFVSSAQKSEFWPALLEKAYAKLNGSYEALNGGWISEAFVDFTGGVGESVDLKAAPPNLCQIIRAAVEKKSLMGASINILDQSESEMRTPEGLVKGHAYSIICISEVEYNGRKLPLFRLRNPWGQVEWNGRWSDNSATWSLLDNATRQKFQITGEDGEFWMELDDFLRYFDTLDICNLTRNLACQDLAYAWNANSFQGSWVRGHNAGGCRNYRGTFWSNPQYLVTVEGEDKERLCTVLASLLQKEGRKARAVGRDFLVIGFEIFKFSDMNLMSQRATAISGLIPMVLTPYIAKRDVTSRHDLLPGQYVIIPTTFMPQEESSFTLRVFTETQHTLKEIDCIIKAEAKVFQAADMGSGETPRARAPRKTSKTGCSFFKLMKSEQNPPKREPPSMQEDKLQLSNEEFRKYFTEVSGRDQEISPEELQSIMVQITSKHSHLKTDGFSIDTCNQLLKIADRSGNGKLQLEEFRYLWSKIKEWEHIFTKYDVDRSGTMDVQELRLALEAAGFQLNNKLVEQLCTKYGDDLRRLDFDSFLSCLAHLVGVFDECRKMKPDKDGVVTLGEQQWLQMTNLQ